MKKTLIFMLLFTMVLGCVPASLAESEIYSIPVNEPTVTNAYYNREQLGMANGTMQYEYTETFPITVYGRFIGDADSTYWYMKYPTRPTTPTGYPQHYNGDNVYEVQALLRNSIAPQVHAYTETAVTYDTYDNAGLTTNHLYFKYDALYPAPTILEFNVGSENAGRQVEILNYLDEVVAVVEVSADGSVKWDPNGYVYLLPYAVAYAKLHVTSHELVADNDCATFASHLLTAGGMAVYQVYTHIKTGTSHGLWNQLLAAGIAHEGTPENGIPGPISLSHARPGDVIWVGNGGHVMFVAEYNETTQEYHIIAHSTSAKHDVEGFTDDCWVSRDLTVDAIMHLSNYVYRFRFVDTEEPLGNIKIVKKDEDTGAVLQGAEFDLLNADEEVVASGVTSQSGVLEFNDLPEGEYTLVETRAPTGYQ